LIVGKEVALVALYAFVLAVGLAVDVNQVHQQADSPAGDIRVRALQTLAI
jgi:hypothetical protein